MSNGYFIFAKVDTADDGYLLVRECWGHRAPDYSRTFEITDGDVSLYVTPEDLDAMIDQVKLTKEDVRQVVEELDRTTTYMHPPTLTEATDA